MNPRNTCPHGYSIPYGYRYLCTFDSDGHAWHYVTRAHSSGSAANEDVNQ